MKNLFYLLTMITIISCGKSEDNVEEMPISGTWILESVSGSCFGIPIEAQADEDGCLSIPNLEVNCLTLEFLEDGQLQYTINNLTAIGSYLFDAGILTICTNNCLGYQILNGVLSLVTNSIAECNPTYSFRKIG